MTRKRATSWLLALAVVPLILISIEVAKAPRTSDFGCFWASGRVVLDGADPYDEREWALRHAGTYTDATGVERAPFCGPRWPYPLWTALFFVPWAALPLGTAAVLWQLTLGAGVAGGIALIARATGGDGRHARELTLLTAVSQPLWLTVLAAQFGGLLLLMLGVLAVWPVRAAPAALVATALLIKPHVLAFVAVTRVLAGGRRAIAISALTLSVAVVLCEVVRPRWWSGWLAELGGYRARVATTEATSLWNLSGIVFGDVRWAVIPIAVALAGIVWARGRRRPVDDLAAAVTVSLLVTPYAGSHDHLALVVPWAVILGIARARGGTWGSGVTVALVASASVVPVLLYAARLDVGGREATNALTPLITAGLLVFAQRGARAATPALAPGPAS